MTDFVLEAEDVSCTFRVSGGFMRAKRPLRAVRGVSLALRRGEAVGLVGESGCGKSTLAMLLLGLLRPTAGRIRLQGQDIASWNQRQIAARIQPVFQDPYASLNPRKTIGQIVELPLRALGIGEPRRRRTLVEAIMERVGLPSTHYHSYPNQLSGGQRQRAAIARALVTRPDIVICDEPTSALDVSVQAQVLNLLLELQQDLDLTVLLISHNLAVVEHMTSRVAVMYLGRIVEEADTETLFRAPRHPYTRALLSSVLTPEPGAGIPDTQLGTVFPDPMRIPAGCSFHPRCPKAAPRCRETAPIAGGGPRRVECHFPDEAVAAAQVSERADLSP